jgi:hypothetical protein
MEEIILVDILSEGPTVYSETEYDHMKETSHMCCVHSHMYMHVLQNTQNIPHLHTSPQITDHESKRPA